MEISWSGRGWAGYLLKARTKPPLPGTPPRCRVSTRMIKLLSNAPQSTSRQVRTFLQPANYYPPDARLSEIFRELELRCRVHRPFSVWFQFENLGMKSYQ